MPNISLTKMLSFMIILILVGLTYAEPPTGGAVCTSDAVCHGGSCSGNTNNTVCVCPDYLANTDCSHPRVNRYVASFLELFGGLVGIGGIGQFMLGYTLNGFVTLGLNIIHTIGFVMFVVVTRQKQYKLWPPNLLFFALVVTIVGMLTYLISFPFSLVPIVYGLEDKDGYATYL
jgi:hypothetical protein